MSVARWRGRLPRTGPEARLADWLREPDSLTARLRRHGRFRIRLLRQQPGRAYADEAQPLGLPPRARCRLREVVLFCDDAPLVFAHTLLPARPRGVLTRWFAGLGTRSLGSLLFAHPGFARGPLAHARLDRRHPLYAAAAAALGVAPAHFCARRCVHRYHGQAVLVTEVFSPAIAALPALVRRDKGPSRPSSTVNRASV